jgi:hypothetical protein
MQAYMHIFERKKIVLQWEMKEKHKFYEHLLEVDFN